MDGGALNLIKTGEFGPESPKQPEIALNAIPIILSNLCRQLAAPFRGWLLTAP
jgi:hypothetical protein